MLWKGTNAQISSSYHLLCRWMPEAVTLFSSRCHHVGKENGHTKNKNEFAHIIYTGAERYPWMSECTKCLVRLLVCLSRPLHTYPLSSTDGTLNFLDFLVSQAAQIVSGSIFFSIWHNKARFHLGVAQGNQDNSMLALALSYQAGSALALLLSYFQCSILRLLVVHFLDLEYHLDLAQALPQSIGLLARRSL